MKKVKLKAKFAGTGFVWKIGDEVDMTDAEAERLEAANFGTIIGEAEEPQAEEPAGGEGTAGEGTDGEGTDGEGTDGDDQVEVYELPAISAGAKKLITELKLTDAQIAQIVPTGKNGIINRDVETYLETIKE